MKGLLFFLTNTRETISKPMAATLAWLAKEKGIEFETYHTGRPATQEITQYFPKKTDTVLWMLKPEEVGLGYMGGVAPFDEGHCTDLYYLWNYYDVIACTNTVENRRFHHNLKPLREKFISRRVPNEVSSFYNDVFSYFETRFPEEALMVPSTPSHVKNQLLLESYCYPDIYFSRKLGLDTTISDQGLNRLQDLGVKQIDLLYTPEDTAQKMEEKGFKTRIIDTIKPKDTYGAITKRIFDRWKKQSEGVAYGDPNLATYWTSFFCRNSIVCMFDLDWKNFTSIIASCADEVHSKVIWGRQLSDDFIPLLSKHDKILAIIDAGRPAFTIKRRIPYTPAPLIQTFWNCELSDDKLEERASRCHIAVTLLFYAADVRHLTIASSLFPIASLMRTKVGVAVPVDAYEYIPEWMDDLYITHASGGSMPYIEPMIGSAGLGVATEAKEYLSEQTLKESLTETRKKISNQWGEAFVPVGYYPFQDACPFYNHGSGEPQFEAIRMAGFQYCITYKDEGKLPRIVYENNGFVAINQQTIHWTKNPLMELKRWEKKLLKGGKPGWIIISLDAPFWNWMYYEMENGKKLIDALSFINKGGTSCKLFSATPHEIARYAKIRDNAARLS